MISVVPVAGIVSGPSVSKLAEAGAGPELLFAAFIVVAILTMMGYALKKHMEAHVQLATAYREIAVEMSAMTKAIERLAENQNAVISVILKEGKRDEK